jgi:hypothetical protein
MKTKAFSIIEVLILVVIIGLFVGMFVPIGLYVIQGAGVCGPTRTQAVTIERLYVDANSGSSHYMVGTDQGVFEVDNGLFLWVWNSDELYAQLKEGQRFLVRTEGNRVVNFFLQEYPYITYVEPLR